MKSYDIAFTPTARQMLARIKNHDILGTIIEKAEGLKQDPEKQGKPLLYTLQGLRSIPAAGRYRIIYRVDRGRVVVLILAVGQRKEGDSGDVYELAKKLIRSGLI